MCNCVPDKLCLGCTVAFLETTIIATCRMTEVCSDSMCVAIFYLGLQLWCDLLICCFIWLWLTDI